MNRILLYFLFLIYTAFSQPIIINWSELNTGTATTLNSVSDFGSFIVPAVWACGSIGTVIKSTDNGANWINVSSNGIPSNIELSNIFVLDRYKALTAGNIGSNTFVYKTINGGSNWQQVFSQTNGKINAIWIYYTTGFMVGDPVNGRWSLWKSSNEGTTWDSTGLRIPQVGTEKGWNNSLWLSGVNIWFGTNNSKIYFSTNTGLNWTSQSTGTEVNSFTIWFNYYTTKGFTGGSNLLTSTNQGLNWIANTSPGNGDFGGITGLHMTYLYNWYVRSSNIIYSSTNNGINWSVAYTAPSGFYRYISLSRDMGSPTAYIYAIRNNGGITRGRLLIPDGIIKKNNSIPQSYKLSQNYPNPFNPSTTIDFDLPKSSFVTLKVYNILGEEIAVLINENLGAGSYEYKWNTGNISSGIYYCTFETGNFRDTKKMVLIK